MGHASHGGHARSCQASVKRGLTRVSRALVKEGSYAGVVDVVDGGFVVPVGHVARAVGLRVNRTGHTN